MLSKAGAFSISTSPFSLSSPTSPSPCQNWYFHSPHLTFLSPFFHLVMIVVVTQVLWILCSLPPSSFLSIPRNKDVKCAYCFPPSLASSPQVPHFIHLFSSSLPLHCSVSPSLFLLSLCWKWQLVRLVLDKRQHETRLKY